MLNLPHYSISSPVDFLLCNSHDQKLFSLFEYLQCYLLSHVQLFATPWAAAHQLLFPWNSPFKSAGMGCHSLLQEIFLTQGLKPGLPHCRHILYHLLLLLNLFSCVWLCATLQTAACQAPPSMGTLQARILEWVAMSSSRGSSQPRNLTALECNSMGTAYYLFWLCCLPRV